MCLVVSSGISGMGVLEDDGEGIIDFVRVKVRRLVDYGVE